MSVLSASVRGRLSRGLQAQSIAIYLGMYWRIFASSSRGLQGFGFPIERIGGDCNDRD